MRTSLQHKGKNRLPLSLRHLTKDSSDQSLELFWEAAKKRAEQLEIAEPKLPRKRKLPDYYDGTNTGNATPHFHDSLKDSYRAIYFETYDSIIGFIQRRFDQPDYHTYMYLQETLIKAAVSEDYEENLKKVCQFYDDINQFALDFR